MAAEVLNCDIVVNEFEFQSRCYVHCWTNTLEIGINPFISISGGLNSITTVLLQG